MPDSKVRFDELITALRERNFRLTPQRVELVRLIAGSKDHPNVAQLYAIIRTRFPTMSQATVYKTPGYAEGYEPGIGNRHAGR